MVYADGTREDYTYDGASRVSTITHTDRNGTQLDYYEYTYDAAGNLTEEKNRYGSTRYTYDANRRLKSVTEPEGRTTTYTYDTAGNRATKEVSYRTEEPVVTTYTYNSSNQLMTETTGDEATTYTYDSNGNLVLEERTVSENVTEEENELDGEAVTVSDITVTEPESDTKIECVTESAIRYTYDAFNRMTGYEADGVTATYSYNAEDYRTGKNVIDSSGNKNIQYFYEGNRVIMEADSSGCITSHNLYGAHLAGRSVPGEEYYYLYNAHGDVVMLLDSATGTVVGTYRYDAFGNVILETGTPDNSVTYAGYQYDEETGLYYLNARYYDSATARFLTEDTYRGSYRDPLSLNRYTYCHNNPLIYWDPTGHAAKKYEDDHFYSLATRRRHPRCKIGSAGSYVYQMELMLEKAGYRTGNCKDGIFDGQTLRAVRMFQEDNGLKVTGIVEQRAWAFLEIQSQLKNLENRYNRKLISEEEYLTQVYGLKKMAGNVPYKYDDKTLEKAMSDIYAIYNMALSIELALLETQVAVLTMGVSELIGDGADLIQDVYDAVVNKSPGAVGSIVFDSACLLVPDGPLNYADNVVDDVGDVAKKINRNVDNVTDATKKAGSGSNSLITLTDAQRSRLNSLDNTINDHLTESDFSGTLRDLLGDPVPNGKGGYFDHAGEMKDSYRALQKIKNGLEGSLKNPNLINTDRALLQDGLNKANSYLRRIEELFEPYGGIR